MNIYELQHRFDLEVAKYGITEPILSSTIEDYINYAYQNYITEKYDSLINPQESFEKTERLSRILAPLITDYLSTSFIPITTNSPFGYSTLAPQNLQYIIKESLLISKADCNGNIVPVTCRVFPIKHHQVEANKKNPFLRPSGTDIWRLNYSNKIEFLLYEGALPLSYSLRYLKKHSDVNFNPIAPALGQMEIDSSVHAEIVLSAVFMFLADNNKKNGNSGKE